MGKASHGNFFEDFHAGQVIAHAIPRTITTGDVALYSALYGMRFALQSSDDFARQCGLPASPIDNLLLFHVIFGKSVPDVSLNAVANLGYAECRFLAPAWPGDSFTARSEVIGLRGNANGQTGIVHVRTTGFNQHGAAVLSFVRWVMVNRRTPGSAGPEPVTPQLAAAVDGDDLVVPDALDLAAYDDALAGSPHRLEDYRIGETIAHVDGMTIEEAEHQLATRLYQNTARPHFDAVLQRSSRFARRLVYGGHIISLARALSYNGLENGCILAAINAGRHVRPAFAGDTIYAWSEVKDIHHFPHRPDIGALRLRSLATRDAALADAAPDPQDETILLDLDYWILVPRRARG